MRVGIDIGGTFTDLVAATPQGVSVVKVSSTPADPAEAFLTALGRAGGTPEEVRHGTTVATNAVLTRSGARLAFLATEGFRHILHLARQDRPSLYDLRAMRPEPLVPLELCIAVPERVGPHGEVIRPLDAEALRRALSGLDVEGVAVTLLHSYANDAHERATADVVGEVLGDVKVSLSCDVLPEFREYERASTTVLNAYVQPVLDRYLGRIRDAASGRLGVMWSGGGVRGMAATIERPVHTLLSGPAAGVLAAAWTGSRSGHADIVSIDIGGTSADVGMVSGGAPLVAEESSLDGLPFRTPCLDVVSVGAGGGSVGWVDEGGALRVGPRSAGADPGPACYGRGGTEATVTDAHVVLGHLGSDGLAGGDLPLVVDAAHLAVEALGRRASMSTVEAAEGMLRVVRATMGRAIRSVTIERGNDVRDFGLVAFGGAGPLHGAALARELGIGSVVVPPAPGALAALGLLVAARRADASVSRPMAVEAKADGDLRAIVDDLTEQVTAELREEGVDASEVSCAVDCRYAGQSHELRIALDGRPSFARVRELFDEAHRGRYGFARPEAGVEAVTFRAAAAGPPGDVEVSAPAARGEAAPVGSRRVDDTDVPVYAREDLPAGGLLTGPAIVAELDSTTWIPSGVRAEVHASGALVMSL